MATRSAIGKKFGTCIKAVYCHWDGYPEGVGKMLLDNYSSSPRVANMIALGNMSYLREELDAPQDQSHTFDKPVPGVTVFYGRDRKESDSEYEVFESQQDFINYYLRAGCEYFYLMDDDNQWLVCTERGKMTPLVDVLTESVKG